MPYSINQSCCCATTANSCAPNYVGGAGVMCCRSLARVCATRQDGCDYMCANLCNSRPPEWPLAANPNLSWRNVNSVRTVANTKKGWQGVPVPLATWLYNRLVTILSYLYCWPYRCLISSFHVENKTRPKHQCRCSTATFKSGARQRKVNPGQFTQVSRM